jgi:hypothetical protein
MLPIYSQETPAPAKSGAGAQRLRLEAADSTVINER